MADLTDADLDYAEAYVETLGALTELATRSTDELTPIESTPVAVPMTMVTTSTLRALLAAVRRGRRIEAAARRVDAWMAQDRYTQLEKVDGGFDLRAALAEEPDEFRAALMEVTLQGRDIRVHWWHPDGYGARDNDGCLDT
jgi:hypothetical protein